MAIRHTESQFVATKAGCKMKAPQRRETRDRAHPRETSSRQPTRAFVEIGVHDATMQDIAREAGYTAASLYTYFRSKQESSRP